MKIGIDGRLWNETGVGRYIRALVAELGNMHTPHEFTLFLKDHEYSQLTLPVGWNKVRAQVSWHTFQEQVYMPQVYKKSQVDLLHLPYFSVPLLTPVPFVVTIHDVTISHFATGKATTQPLPIYLLKRLGYTWTLKHALSKACNIITVSETVKQQLIKEYRVPSAKISVTYEAGLLENVTSRPPIDLPKNYILYVGNAHPHKNLENLIKAFGLVRKTIPGLSLVFVGKNDFFYTRLQQYATNQQLSPAVKFVGEVDNGQLSQWYKGASVFVFPSKSEGFGIPGLEAMSVGCPVVATDIPIFHEIYGSAALYSKIDHQNLATTIVTLLKDPRQRSTLVKRGYEQAEKYSWKRMARETLTLYESCAGL
jgi:glycosyltransferase involved in cell wall biosynthesis